MTAAIRQATFFPEQALRKKQYGEVLVRFRIDVKGELKLLEVIQTSGAVVLDDAAREIIRKAVHKFPPVPAGLAEDDLLYTIPILFKRRGMARSS